MIAIETKIFLKDAQGKVLQVKELNTDIVSEFELSSLTDGVYYIELQLPNSKSIMHQFNVNNN